LEEFSFQLHLPRCSFQVPASGSKFAHHAARPIHSNAVPIRGRKNLAGARRGFRRAPLVFSRSVSRVLDGMRTTSAYVTAIPLGRRLPGASSNLPGRPDLDTDPEALRACARKPRAVPIRSCSRWGLPCRRRCRRRGALLPHRFTLAAAVTQRTAAVCSLWHFPWTRARRMLSGTVCPRSPDFPPRQPFGFAGAAVRPTDRHRDGGVGRRRQEATRRSKLMTRAAMLLGRPRCASKSCKVARVEASLTPSMRSGRKWRWNAATTSCMAES
jgi:hypothetical protein